MLWVEKKRKINNLGRGGIIRDSRVIWNYILCKRRSSSKTIISRINTRDISQKRLLSVFILILSKSPSVFSSYYAIINYVHETWFSKHIFKRTRWLLKICKIFDKLSRPKIRELLPQYGRKYLVTIFFEQRIKEKLNTWFDYYFWECCLLYLLY